MSSGCSAPLPDRRPRPSIPAADRRPTCPSRCPSSGEPLQLHVDFLVRGNPIQAIRIDEHVVDRLTIAEGAGQLVYRAGSFSARHLCGIRPVDATIVFHGGGEGRSLEVLTFRGDGLGSLIGRRWLTVERFGQLATAGRRALQQALVAESSCEADVVGVGAAAAARLAAHGEAMRMAVVGPNPPADPDGTVLVALDTEATRALTLPFSILHDGHDAAADHGSPGIILDGFWGLRYELAWPNGRVPRTGRSESVGLGRLARRASAWRRRPLRGGPTVLDNRVPVGLLTIADPELARHDGLHRELDRYGPSLDQWTVHGLAELEARFEHIAPEIEVVVVLAHGVDRRASESPLVGGRDYALQLGDELLTASDIRLLGRTARLERGPLVVVNACRSGGFGWEGHDLLDALHEVGAQAIVVTESDVRQREVTAITRHILGSVLAGTHVSRAVLDARRADLGTGRGLGGLAHTYYGPPGLRLARPIRPAVN